MKMIKLEVPDMQGLPCRVKVTGALLGVDPAAVCDVDLENKHVAVESTYMPSDFIEALEEVGFSAFLAQP
jgi:copper chaperone CopZ